MKRIEVLEIHTLAKVIGAQLKGFAYIADKRQLNGDGEPAYYALLTQTDAHEGVPPMQLSIDSGYNVRGMLRISLHAVARDHEGKPVNVHDTLPSSTEVASVRVSVSRAESAARDIERRLLPTAREQWAIMLARQADQNDYAMRTAQGVEAMRALGASFGSNSRNEGHLSVGDAWGKATVCGDNITLDLHSLTLEQATRVIGALKGE